MIEHIIIGVVFIVSFILSIALGAGSTGSTPYAPAVGANAITTLKAAFIIGIVSLLGAILQGQSVAETIGNDLISGVTLMPVEITIILLIGSLFMFIGIYTGYPIATAFTFTGAFIGAGIAIGGSPVYNLYFQILIFWTLGPIVSIVISYLTIKTLLSKKISNNHFIPLLFSIVLIVLFNIRFNIPRYGMTSLQEFILNNIGSTYAVSIIITVLISITITLLLNTTLKTDLTKNINYFLIFLGSVVGFSAGASQVGLAVGALIPITQSTGIPYYFIFYLGGFGLLLGSWLMAPRMIKSISQDYGSLGTRRSISALFSAFILAQLAVQFGFPISFNQIMISSIVGSSIGVNKGNESVDSQKIVFTILIWTLTIIVSYVLSYIFVSII